MTDPSMPAGTVTVGDLFREITGMRAEVARALTRIELLDARNTDAEKLHSDHETRIRALERFRWQLVGAWLVLTALSVYVGWLLGHAR